MIPILSIVGKSDSGKTFLIERLIEGLTGRGYRVATVKHDVHGFEMDREGKDSWRHKKAGASMVVVSSPAKIAVIKDVEEEEDLERIRAAWIRDVDLILTEGYKRAGFPKIEAALFGDPARGLLCRGEDRLEAVVSSHAFEGLDVPVFGEDEIDRLVAWVEERFLKEREERGPRVEVSVDGRAVALNPETEERLWAEIAGAVEGLEVEGTGMRIEIRISEKGSGT